MNREKLTSWFPYRRQSRRNQEPSAALFQGLRIRLTLWYCGVLGAALVLFCVALYLIAQFVLLTPIQNGVISDANGHANQWSTGSSFQACNQQNGLPTQDGPPHFGFFPNDEQHMLACFDQNGTLLNANTAQWPSAFLTNTLVKQALQDGKASDTVNAGGTTGTIYRYAVAVPSPSGHGYVGVVVSGAITQTATTVLSILLVLLPSVGGVTLLGAAFGGLFLASRALAPAHLAFTRQQRFIADASHELRTPLTLMRADAEVLLRGREHMAVEDAALLEDIVAEANHMSTLASSMLALARLDANAQHREHEVVSLDALARQGVQRVSAFAEQKSVVVQQEETDAAFVIGDPMLLEQALLVLLDNAIKYNRPGGQVAVRTSIHERKARLEVCDTGIGIPAEHLPHLGERFYRVDKARSREAGGTGLGLSIAQHIATIHDGTMTLTSVPNAGTTVTLLFPLAQNKPSQHRDAGTTPSVGTDVSRPRAETMGQTSPQRIS